MNSPKISVIVPVYNVEPYVQECLDSILNQTLREIEVICIDAGSSDNSASLLREIAKTDDRVTFQEGFGRLDAGAARNIGLNLAKGEYLSFLDSDDLFHPRMLEAAYEKITAENADIVVFSAQQLNMRTGTLTPMPWSLKTKNCPRHSPFSPKAMPKYLFDSFQNWAWNKLFRADFIKTHNISFQSIARTNDMAFTCEALALAERISILPKIYATYRVGTGTSLQQTNDRAPTSFWEAYKETRNRLIARGVYQTYKQSFVNTVLAGTIYNLQSVKTDEAYHEILYLLRYRGAELDLEKLSKSDIYIPGVYRDYLSLTCSVLRNPRPVEQPKVTVVLPCLNSRPYIRECVESILNQTLEELELLIVDAGSTDGTLEILRQYAQIDPRVQILTSPKKSYGYQINMGLQAARGEYFAIVESDDFIHISMYDDLCRIADRHQLEVLKADYCTFTGTHNSRSFEQKSILIPHKWYNKVLNPRETPQVFQNYVVSWCGIYRTDFLKEHHIYHHESPGASFQDNGFWFQVFTQASRVMFYGKPYYMLRRDNPGSSVFSPEKAYCMFREYDFIRAFLAGKPELEKIYAPLCAYKRYQNYLWANDNLVSDENRLEYLTRFSEDFRKIQAQGELDAALFTAEEWADLQTLLENPQDFRQESASEPPKRNKIAGLVQCWQEHGGSYTLRYLTKKPRGMVKKISAKAKNGLRCFADHGLVYTIQYGLKRILH